MGKGQCIYIPNCYLDRWPVTAAEISPPANLKLMKYKRSTKLFYFFKYFLKEINALLSFFSLFLQAAFLSHSEAAA